MEPKCFPFKLVDFNICIKYMPLDTNNEKSINESPIKKVEG